MKNIKYRFTLIVALFVFLGYTSAASADIEQLTYTLDRYYGDTSMSKSIVKPNSFKTGSLSSISHGQDVIEGIPTRISGEQEFTYAGNTWEYRVYVGEMDYDEYKKLRIAFGCSSYTTGHPICVVNGRAPSSQVIRTLGGGVYNARDYTPSPTKIYAWSSDLGETSLVNVHFYYDDEELDDLVNDKVVGCRTEYGIWHGSSTTNITSYMFSEFDGPVIKRSRSLECRFDGMTDGTVRTSAPSPPSWDESGYAFFNSGVKVEPINDKLSNSFNNMFFSNGFDFFDAPMGEHINVKELQRPDADITQPAANVNGSSFGVENLIGQGTAYGGATIGLYEWTVDRCGTGVMIGNTASINYDLSFLSVGQSKTVYFRVMDSNNTWSECDSVTFGIVNDPPPTSPVVLAFPASPAINQPTTINPRSSINSDGAGGYQDIFYEADYDADHSSLHATSFSWRGDGRFAWVVTDPKPSWSVPGDYSVYVRACDAARRTVCSAWTEKVITVTDAVGNTLAVTKAGNGSVVSFPVGISCDPTCSYDFNLGTTVILTAAPDVPTDTITWSGGCTGTGDTCSIVMDMPKTVNVEFSAAAPTMDVDLQGTPIVLGPGEILPQDTTLTWTITGNTTGYSCSASGGNWSGSYAPVNSSESVSQNTSPTTYTLTCSHTSLPDAVGTAVVTSLCNDSVCSGSTCNQGPIPTDDGDICSRQCPGGDSQCGGSPSGGDNGNYIEVIP